VEQVAATLGRCWRTIEHADVNAGSFGERAHGVDEVAAARRLPRIEVRLRYVAIASVGRPSSRRSPPPTVPRVPTGEDRIGLRRGSPEDDYVQAAMVGDRVLCLGGVVWLRRAGARWLTIYAPLCLALGVNP
jgi:hypothetical protein